MQKLGALCAKMRAHNRGQHLRPSQPPAQADQLGQFLILHFVHRLLHAILGAIELLPHVLPLSFVRCLRDRFCMRSNGIAHANSLRQRQHTLPNVFYGRRILRLNCDKTIGNHRSEQKGNTRSLGKICPLFRAHEFLPVDRPEFIQGAKHLIGQWHHHVLHFFRELFYIDMLGSLRRLGAERHSHECIARPLLEIKR